MRVLHILPRWQGGGPERDLLELARQDSSQDQTVERRVLVLDRPISAPLLLRGRRLGVSLVQGNWRDELAREIEDADVVEICFWNHPLLYELFSQELPACRLVIRCAIAGNSMPQIVPRNLIDFPDCWVLSAPEGYGSDHRANGLVPDRRIPWLADMSRLADYVPREHSGVQAAYLGSLEYYKLHSEFPEIVSRFDQSIRCLLIGDASPRSQAALLARFHKLGLAHRVIFSGHVENITAALEEADIFTYPLNSSAWSTSDKTLQEAMWLGLPPVLMAGTALDGWVTHGNTGFVATDVSDFAELVNKLADDETLREQLGAGAQQFARTHFDPARNATKITSLHRDLLSLPKRQRDPYGSSERLGAERFLDSVDLDFSSFSKLLERAPDDFSAHNFNLLHGEGGIAHYLHYFPEDSSLQTWYQVLANRPGEQAVGDRGPGN